MLLMLLMVEKGTRGGISHAIHWYEKTNSKHMKDYDKNKGSSYVQYWDLNNIYGWAMSQKLPVNNFKWVRDISEFNEDFIKNYNDESSEQYLLEVDVQYPGKYPITFTMICPFCLRGESWKSQKACC